MPKPAQSVQPFSHNTCTELIPVMIYTKLINLILNAESFALHTGKSFS